MNCPACGLGKEYQLDAETDKKSRCRGCGTIYFNKEKVSYG